MVKKKICKYVHEKLYKKTKTKKIFGYCKRENIAFD